MFNNKDVVKTVRKASLNFNLCMTQVTESSLEKRFQGIWLNKKSDGCIFSNTFSNCCNLEFEIL